MAFGEDGSGGGTGADFVKFRLNVTQSCENGAGKVVANVVTDSSEQIQYALIGETVNFSRNATSAARSQVFENVPDGTYTVFASLLLTQQGNASVGDVVVACGFTEIVTCDLLITEVKTTDSLTTVASGTAEIIYSRTGNELVSFQIDNILPWSTTNLFYSLAPGLHVARVRYIENYSCIDEFEFEIKAPNIVGCMNEEADNYNPLATEDDGSCLFTPKVYATGGTLPNPVYVPVSLPTTVNGIQKTNHYVDLKIYKAGESVAFATLRQTLIAGKARINIATYLRNRMQNALQVSPLMILGNPNNSMGYYVGIVEHYGGQVQPERLRTDPSRFAVNAALQDYPGDLSPYVVSPGGVLKDFMYAISDPILVEGYNQSVSLFIRPDAPQPLYFQRRYLDARRQNVEIRSTLIPAYLYGTRLDFNLYDQAILCAEYLEVTIQTEQNLLTGICPEIPEEEGIFDYTFSYEFE